MPALLRKGAPKLLKTVGNKSHATQDDHADHFLDLPTPPATSSTRSSINNSVFVQEEDINKDPESSDEENVAPTSAKTLKTLKALPSTNETIDRSPPTFKQPTSSAGSKRTNEEASDSDGDGTLFGQPYKRPKKAGLVNFHAPVRKPKAYGKAAQPKSSQTSNSGGPKLKQLREVEEKEMSPPKPVFRQAGGSGDGLRERDNTDERSRERQNSLSPAISPVCSISGSPDAQKIEELDLSESNLHDWETECTICGAHIDSLLRETFHNEFTDGKAISSYKWQQRFCRWHQQQEAKALWKQREYPSIDWDVLEKRMRQHHAHLKAIIKGKKASRYRNQFRENVKSGSKTAGDLLAGGGEKRGASVGYYGPRGERLMTEHILTHLSEQIRQQSSRDELVAAYGVSGGVSGFVQSVLVPELAQELIKQDMGVSDERARGIVVESAELGELMHPDVDDELAKVAETTYA